MKDAIVERALAVLPRRKRTAPLVCFVHVPKAAGTSINSHLRQWSLRGVAHVERFAAVPSRAGCLVPRCDWVSGHLSFEKWRGFLDRYAAGRECRLFGVIRDPTAHVAAHYNWQIEIFHRGERFYEAHPQAIRDLSARIRATDHSDPAQVVAALGEAPAIFSNLQARYLLGDDIDLGGAIAETRFAEYARIETTQELSFLIAAMTGNRPATVARANESRWHFDRAVFGEPEVQSFLSRFNARDIMLFNRVSRAGPARG